MADDVIVWEKWTTYNNDNSNKNDKNENNRSSAYKGRRKWTNQQETRKVEEENAGDAGDTEPDMNDPVAQLAYWKERRESCQEHKPHNDNSNNYDKNENNRSRDYEGEREQEKQQAMRKVEEEYNIEGMVS